MHIKVSTQQICYNLHNNELTRNYSQSKKRKKNAFSMTTANKIESQIECTIAVKEFNEKWL